MQQKIYAGIDTSSTNDWASLALLFPPSPEDKNRRHRVEFQFWVPEQALQQKSIDLAIGDQFIVTPGEVIDHQQICATLRHIASKYPISAIGFDRWDSTVTLATAHAAGIEIRAFGMGYDDMFAPTMRMRLLKESGMLATENPVFDWMLGNLRYMQHADGRIKPDVGKSLGSVSGVLSLILAFAAMVKHETSPRLATAVTSIV